MFYSDVANRRQPVGGALNDERQTVGSMSREKASIQRVMEIRGREISEFAKVRELDEPHRHRVDTREHETVRTQSGEHERNPIPMYYGKRKDLS